MLKVTVPATEQYDESRNEFIYSKEQTLQLEHSLVSLSKWESKWKKPFMTREDKTPEESLDYIRCMTLTQNVDDSVYFAITPEIIAQVKAYINDPMTATTFAKEEKTVVNRTVITAELIYYWMVAFQIPWECQKWHLNRLLTLINICDIKNKPPKKMNPREAMSKRRALNTARRNKYNTKG